MAEMNIDVAFDNIEQMAGVFGNFDENINIIGAETNTAIRATEYGICITGEKKNAQLAADVIEVLKKCIVKMRRLIQIL